MSAATDTPPVCDGLESTLSTVTQVVVHRTDGALFAVHGTLVEASAGGLMLSLDSCIANGTTVSLHITFVDPSGDDCGLDEGAAGYVDGQIELDARIAWTKPGSHGKWITGCQCAEAWPDDVFTMFARRGHFERRREARRPTRLVAMVCWHRSLVQRLIDITDASSTGFAVRAEKMGAAGEQLVVHFNAEDGEQVALPATLRWKMKTEAGYVGGCLLDDPADHVHIAPYIVMTPRGDSKPRRIKRTRQAARPRINAAAPTHANRTYRGRRLAVAAVLLSILIGAPLIVSQVLHTNRLDDTGAPIEETANDTPDESSALAEVVPVPPSNDETRLANDGDPPESASVDTSVSSNDDTDDAVAVRNPVEVASGAFARGREALAAGKFEVAVAAFAEAAAAMPQVAMYQYHWALALHLDGQDEAAEARLRRAADVEHEHGLVGWGPLMSRVQGNARLWLERGRRRALDGE